MRLRIVSDLHFEFMLPSEPSHVLAQITARPFDVLIVAGDIADTRRLSLALTLLAESTPQYIVYVPGNHESYGGSIQNTLRVAREKAKRYENLLVLDRGVATIEGQRFVGATLWYPSPGPVNWGMGDTSCIKGAVQRIPAEAEASAAWLDAIQPGDCVITHFLPHPMSIAEQWKRSSLNGYFLHDVSPIVESGRAKLWIHGHTHTSMDYIAPGGTRVVCNPMGYLSSPTPGEPNAAFDPTFTVDI